VHLPAVSGTLDRYIEEINRYPLLSAEEEFSLAVKLVKENSVEAAERLVLSNLRFVVKIAHQYRNYEVRLTDLIQEGNIGLIHAVKKFDPYKGHRLISYAVWWIRAYIQNYIMKTWSIVKIGTTQAQRKLFYKMSQTRKELARRSEKNPELQEIADSLGVMVEDVIEMDNRFVSRDLSLDAGLAADGPSSDQRGASLLDILSDPGENQEMALIRKEEQALIKRDIAQALTSLNERENFIIKNRILVDNPLTLQEIGDMLKITRERVRQLEKQALKKLELALPYWNKETLLLSD
jgi:RNA polymerase sigma-32 factor